MGTETISTFPSDIEAIDNPVKLNDPLMGTETISFTAPQHSSNVIGG